MTVGPPGVPGPPAAVVVRLARSPLRSPFKAAGRGADERDATARLLTAGAAGNVAAIARRHGLGHDPGLVTPAARQARAAFLAQLLEALDAGLSIHLECPGAMSPEFYKGPSPSSGGAVAAWLIANRRVQPPKRARIDE